MMDYVDKNDWEKSGLLKNPIWQVQLLIITLNDSIKPSMA